MNNFYGYGVTMLFSVSFISLIISLIYLNKNKRPAWFLNIAIALLPAIYLFVLRARWSFGPNYLPSGSGDDLTFSSFHFSAIALMLTLMGLFFYLAKRQKEYTSSKRRTNSDHILLFSGLFLFGIEVYKQLIFLNLAQGIDHYSWYGFPLQFCSMPLFLYPIAALFKNKLVKRALYSFIGLFMFLAGFLVMIVGGSVFVSDVAISVHTMIWHGAMVVIGFYILVREKIGLKWQDYYGAITVLGILIVFVQIINISFHYSGLTSFDGFFISPFQSTQNMPVLSDIRISLQNSFLPLALSGVLFTLIYFFAFSVGGLLIFSGARLFYIKNARVLKQDKIFKLAQA